MANSRKTAATDGILVRSRHSRNCCLVTASGRTLPAGWRQSWPAGSDRPIAVRRSR